MNCPCRDQRKLQVKVREQFFIAFIHKPGSTRRSRFNASQGRKISDGKRLNGVCPVNEAIVAHGVGDKK